MARRPRNELDPEDVLRGRVRPDSAALCALIRSVNPTGLELPGGERARRYALKSKLQSLLVLRSGAELEVVVDEAAGEGFVLLRHRPTASTAGHALLAELSDDARSWVQHQIDVAGSGAPDVVRPASAPQPASPRRSTPASSPAGGDTTEDLLRAGRQAVLDYDYDTARSLLEQALARPGGEAVAAEALLDLLVERLGADTDALALARAFAASTLAEPQIRRHLALAAARSGDREAALAFVAGVPGAPAVAVFTALARHALGSGDTATATRDHAAARERDPLHPDLRPLGESLAQARAALRRPLEERLIALVAAGRYDEAEAAARDPEIEGSQNADLRSALRTLQQWARRTRATALAARAEEAHRTGDFQAAMALLRRSLVEDPGAEAAAIAGRLTAAEAAERARTETIEAQRLARLLGAADPVEGMIAYVGATAGVRDRVRALRPRPDLEHLDETGVTDTGARARAAVAAVLALARAAEALTNTAAPEVVLAHLEPHGKLLQGVRAAQRIREQAEAARLTRLRAEARQNLERARAVLAPFGFEARRDDLPVPDVPGRTGTRLAQGQALLSELTIRHLHEPERTEALSLRERVAVTLNHQRIADQLGALVGRGEIAAARALLEAHIERGELAVRAPDDPALVSMRDSLNNLIQRSFDVRIAGVGARDLEARGLARAMVTERAVPMVELWGKSLDRQGGTTEGVGGRQLFELASRGHLLFIRVIDFAGAPQLRTFVLLRTPQPLLVRGWEVTADKLIAVGSTGAMIRLSLPDFRVLSWRRPEESPPRASEAEPAPRLISNAMASSDMRLVWTVANRGNGRRTLRVLDLEQTRIVHEERLDSWPVWLDLVTSVPGAAAILWGQPRRTLELRGPDGRPIAGGRFPLDAGLGSTCSHPHGGLFVVGREPATGLFGALRLVLGTAPGSPQPIEGLEIGSVGGCASDRAASLIFVLQEAEGSDRHLIALSAGESGFIRLYRVMVPCRSVLVADVAGQRVDLLVLGRGLFQSIRLGAEPPELPVAPEPLPLLDLSPAQAWGCQTCHAPADSVVATAQRHALRGSWTKVRDTLRGVDEARLGDASARHFAHLLGLSLLHGEEHEEAHRVLLRGQARPGPCDLDALLAVAAPLDESGEGLPAQRSLRDLLRRVAAADVCLAAGDAAGALVLLDDLLIWEALEPQSMARLARAMLGVDRPEADFQIRKAYALATFSDLLHEQSPGQSELFMRERWDLGELLTLQKEAREWVAAFYEKGWMEDPVTPE